MEQLTKNRARREQEEAENKRRLAEKYQREKAAKQKELDKELAVCAQ